MSSPEEVMEVIDEGKANRHVAVTSKYLLFFFILFSFSYFRHIYNTEFDVSFMFYIIWLLLQTDISQAHGSAALC